MGRQSFYLWILFLATFIACTPEEGSKDEVVVETYGELLYPVTNTSVASWNNKAYCFGGIDETLIYSGIHQKSQGVDLVSKEVFTIPSLPDTLGKVAGAASTVGDTIYIAGGYHAYEDGNEKSSDRLHRFDPKTKVFLSDGPPIPVATDDHVQVTYQDRYIYLISGWHDTENINNVQVFDTFTQTWQQATPTPDEEDYKSFGASGVIIGNTIYYLGGATSNREKKFGAQAVLRIGVINPSDPYTISWSKQELDTKGLLDFEHCYRGIAVNADGHPAWIGGSTETYNFDAKAYTDGHIVSPTSLIRIFNPETEAFNVISVQEEIPMDHRGVAQDNQGRYYVLGGIKSEARVSGSVVRLTIEK